MPYSLFELTQMSREQLESVAQEYQIKNARKMTDENLSYAILDAQATAASLEPIERPKAKRGRPRKTSQPKAAESSPNKRIAQNPSRRIPIPSLPRSPSPKAKPAKPSQAPSNHCVNPN